MTAGLQTRTKSRPSEILLCVTAVHQRYDGSLCWGVIEMTGFSLLKSVPLVHSFGLRDPDLMCSLPLKTLDTPVAAAEFSAQLHLQSGR